MKKIVVNLWFVIFLCLVGSCGNAADSEKETVTELNEEQFEGSSMEKDAEFVMKASEGGLFEVELGRLAQQKGSNAQVREFGQMMVDDHSKANSELTSLAQSKNIITMTSLSQEKQEKVDELSQKSGRDFDKAYMDEMVNDHEKDVNAFKDAADNAADNEIKSWAAGKVPTLEMHLQHAKDIKDAIK